MEFHSPHGIETGEVWCPGPVARSVWVLLPDGSAVAVKLEGLKPLKATGEPRPAEQIDEEELALIQARAEKIQWFRLDNHINVPQLSEKDWRAALGQTALEV